jgi:PAS domain S-box-containing protein
MGLEEGDERSWKRPVRMRNWLLLRLGLVVGVAVVAVSFCTFRFIVQPAAEELLNREIEGSFRSLADQERDIVNGLELQLQIGIDCLERNRKVDASDQEFAEAFDATLRSHPEIAGVFDGGLDGGSRSLLRLQGAWRERKVTAADSQARWARIGDHERIGQADSSGKPYDARSDAWFQDALKRCDGPGWSDLHALTYDGEVALTLDRTYRDAWGRTRILAYHVGLEQLTRGTRDVSLGHSGFTMMVGLDGKVLSLPHGRGTDAWWLRPVDSLSDEVVAKAFRSCGRGSILDRATEFRADGRTWMVRAGSLELGRRRAILMAVVRPEEFQTGKHRAMVLLLAITLFLLAANLAMIYLLSGLLTRPMELLASQMHRISALDFSEQARIASPWIEIEQLAQAHEGMRRILEHTTSNMEEEIQEKTAQLRRFYLAIEQSPFAVIITDREGDIEYVNPYALRTSGYSLEELVGRNPRILRSPEADPMALVDLWDTILAGDIWKGEFLNRSKYGRDYLESAIVAPIYEDKEITHFVAIKEDVTQIRAAQKQISDQLALLEQVLDAIPNPIFLKDERLRYILCNRAYEDAFATVREYVQGKTVMDLSHFTPEEKLDRHQDDLKVLDGGETIHATVRSQLADGKLHDMTSWLKRVHLADGSVGGVLGLLIDITDHKAKERELEKARALAEEAAQVKSAFLASMSHEIRTPMNAVIGMAHLALRTRLDEQQRDYVEKIHRAATSLIEIINEILDFSKIEAGMLRLEAEEFDLGDLLGSVADLHRHKAREKGIEYLHRVSAELPGHFVGDSLRLGQILTNLVGNALKFTERGTVSLAVSLVREEEERLLVRFDVRDTGVGLNATQLERLFQAFSQADDSNSRKYGGTGLGLAISKRLVELMGGAIGVTSEPGKGSDFWFTAWLGRDQTSESEFPLGSDGCRVLVVDDNPVVSEVLMVYLSGMGLQPDQASSGRAAMAAIHAAAAEGAPFEIIFLDRKMPEEDGLEVAKSIKGSRLARIPAVVMVTSVDEELLAVRRSIPLDGILDKPVSPHALRRVLADILGREPSLVDSSIGAGGIFELKGVKVLVVENEPVNQQIARELLDTQGVDVAVAQDGVEALERLAIEDFDLVLMDLQMPNMDGFEATRRLRERGFATPILAMTASAMREEKEACLEAGMNDHISKPIDPRRLFQVIARWIDRSGEAVRAERPRDPQELPLLRGVETQEGLERCGGNAAMYSRFLLELATVRLDLQPLRERIEAGDGAQARAWLHSFKGVAGNLGAMLVFNLVVALERDLKEGSLEAALSRLPRLEEEAELLRQEILAKIGIHEPETIDRTVDLPVALGRVLRLLHEADGDAVEAFEAVRKEFIRVHGQGVGMRLTRKIRDFAFEEAIDILGELPGGSLGASGADRGVAR